MWRVVLRHELRLLRRSPAFWTCAGLIVIVIAGAAANGAAWAERQRQTAREIERADADNYARIAADLADLAQRGDPRPAQSGGGLVWYLLQPAGAPAPAPHIDPRRGEAAGSEWVGARYAVLPTTRLAALAIGQSDLHPSYSRVTMRTQPVLIHSDELENPEMLASGRFDLAFVLTFCWPLLVLPLAYDLFSGEREGGTLPLVRAQLVDLRTLMAAKLLARGGSVLLLTVVASIAALLAFAPAAADRGVVPALAAWSALIVVNGGLWFALAAWINSREWSSRKNAMVLVAVWLASLVIVPAGLGVLVPWLAPVPSRLHLIEQARAIGLLSGEELRRVQQAYLERHRDVSPPRDGFDAGAVRTLALQEETDRRLAPALTRHQDGVRRQQRLVDWLRYGSPALLTYEVATELAGTSTARYRAFAAQLAQYHQRWRDYFYPLVNRQVTLTPAHYDNAPRFAFEEPAIAGRVVFPVIAMGFAALVLLTTVFARLGRPRAG
jgi:ABC-2 type transport system permease protein